MTSAAPEPRGLRPQIRAAIEQSPVDDPSELDGYLDALEAQAVRKGEVTALEVEPGLAMLRRHSRDPQGMARFSERMLRLQQKLSGTAPDAPVGPDEAAKRLEQLGVEIQRAGDDSQKQRLIRQYLELLASLPVGRHQRFARELDRIAATQEEAEPRAADELWSAIEREADETARSELIVSYLELVRHLEHNDRQRRLAELNTRFGAAAQ